MSFQVNKKRILNIIDGFRTHCNNLLLEELNCSSLVSHNDQTLRFINSTTSVMKPYIDCIAKYKGIYLIQPSVGFQGVLNWKSKKIISPYSSYFIALGTLFPLKCLSSSIEETEKFLTNILGLSTEDIIMSYYYEDSIFKEHLKKSIFCVLEDSSCVDKYRHRFGNTSLRGKNINIYNCQIGQETEIGNIIVIEKDNVPVAVEVSFDIPLLLQAYYNYPHSVDTLPASEVIMQILPEYDWDKELLELADLVTLGINLMIDGLKIKSRGRGGNLKLTIKLASEIVRNLSIQEWKLYHILLETIKLETEIRKVLKYPEPFQCNEDVIVDNYLVKLRELMQ